MSTHSRPFAVIRGQITPEDFFGDQRFWDRTGRPLTLGSRVHKLTWRDPSQHGTVVHIHPPMCKVIWDGEEDAGPQISFICSLVQVQP